MGLSAFYEDIGAGWVGVDFSARYEDFKNLLTISERSFHCEWTCSISIDRTVEYRGKIMLDSQLALSKSVKNSGCLEFFVVQNFSFSPVWDAVRRRGF